jgi:hypothetical protein
MQGLAVFQVEHIILSQNLKSAHARFGPAVCSISHPFDVPSGQILSTELSL